MSARLLQPDDDEFPNELREPVPPVGRLWVRGRDLRMLGPTVAVVGSRTPTSYGLEVAHDLAADLALNGFCVVSGLARGIDSSAHEGALAAGGTTVAVLGSGIDVVYPPGGAALLDRIVAQGAVVTEQPPGTPPYRSNFRQRNRIIAAISIATVVVQATDPVRSGALLTARFAADLQREVFAVPGDVRSPPSIGPHGLIRDGEAHICTGLGDILQVLAARWAALPVRGDAPVWDPPYEERAVLVALSDGAASVDETARRAGLDPAVIARAITMLEMAGVVQRLPSGRFRRAR